jgi:hypothetical protein
VATQLQHVGAVQARRPHAHEQLAAGGYGVGALLDHELPVLDRRGPHAREI